MTKHAAISTAVAAVQSAGLPIYKPGTPRREAVPGVAVRLGWKHGTLTAFVYGDTVALSDVRAALAGAGFRETYVNEAGGCVTVRRATKATA